MFSDPSQRMEQVNGEGGFTLIELLVVILIIGILAAIAIPSFLNQTSKAVDAQAKSVVISAETAAEALATDDNGSYENVKTVELNKEAPGLRITSSTTEAYLSAATGTKTEYSVTAKATNGDELTISRSATGAITRECLSPISKKSCNGVEHSSW